jgi:diacylglycerol kinase (ATP)
MSWISERVRAFACAGKGLWHMFGSESHARLHLLAVVAVIVLGYITHISRTDWITLVVVCSMVVACEAFNTALERLADAVHPEHHPLVGQAKDVAAGAVLVSALASVIIGALIFLPYWLN